jgi:hypothetical protein
MLMNGRLSHRFSYQIIKIKFGLRSEIVPRTSEAPGRFPKVRKPLSGPWVPSL